MTEPPPNRNEQLRRALAAGLIDQDTFDASVAALAAQVVGSGAVAQGPDALALGAGAVAVQGDNQGTINLGLLIQQGTQPGASPAALTRAYLARILTQANHLPLFIGDGANAQVRLAAVYTALLIQGGAAEAGLADAGPAGGRSPGRPDRRRSALDALNGAPRLVLLGGPGSGKSTFVNFVALAMAGELLGVPGPNLATLTAPLPKEDGDDQDPPPQGWDQGALLPVPVVLRDLASQLPPPGTPVNADTLWQFLCGRLQQAALAEFAPVLKRRLLEQGGLILLDGLDEVPDAHSRRVQIKQAVQDFAAGFSRCRYLVTSRTYAYQRQEWKLEGFTEGHLLPFTPGQVRGFAGAWYAHMVELLRLTEGAARDRAEVLTRTVERNERIRELAERPLLLTLIAQLQTESGGALPERREELYDKAVELLLTKWESMKVREHPDGRREIEPSLAEWLNAGRDDIRRELNRLAFEAHRDQPQLTGTADIRQETLICALLAAGTRHEDQNVGLLERYLRDRAGLLAAHGVGVYQFPHRSFQEYLAACHLTDDEFPDRLADLARADPNRWREVALLAGAKAVRGSALNAWVLAETLCPSLPPPDGPAPTADHWGGLLAGRVLVECADLTKIAQRNEGKLARVREWQLSILRGSTLPATERALAGRTLALLGDPRAEVMTLDGMQFCLVPPGPFVMGDDGNFGDEKPQHTVDLRYPFFIGRFPVTVAQWRDYVQLSGRLPDDERSLSARDNDPVLYLTWHDALQFCAFLGQAWRRLLPPDFVVTLPSEAEWEKAARGGERVPVDCQWVTPERLGEELAAMQTQPRMPNPFPRRAYPWGESFDADKANIESTIGETSAVGCYPAGISPYGCEEMIGNVWEWTRSLWGEDWWKPGFAYPYNPDDPTREAVDAGDKISRVVRGAAWINRRELARSASFYWLQPDDRHGYLGFRIVLRSSPVS